MLYLCGADDRRSCGAIMKVLWRFWNRYRQKYWNFTNSLIEKKGKMPMIDEWSGFADLLANLIEKYAAA
ncbi:MAG: hypothetical protein ACLSB9_05050 [Hydrogeniiclostridium mannosilyticum]